MDDDGQIKVELQHNFYLLGFSLPNFWTDLHQNFTRYSGISVAIKSCIYKALVHSISERQSNEWMWSILTSAKMIQN